MLLKWVDSGVPISKWICYSYSISIKWLWICLYIWNICQRLWNSISIWNKEGVLHSENGDCFSQYRLWLTPIIIRASRYGVGSSSRVMAPLTSKGNSKRCYCRYRYCSRYHRRICFLLASVGLSLLLLVSAFVYAFFACFTMLISWGTCLFSSKKDVQCSRSVLAKDQRWAI